jgi:ATP-dependent DNA helicase RecG
MDIDIKICELMKGNNKISTKEIAEILGISIITVKRKIKKMPNVVFVGSGYSGHWEVTKNE